jgi:hypothetical protein
VSAAAFPDAGPARSEEGHVRERAGEPVSAAAFADEDDEGSEEAA